MTACGVGGAADGMMSRDGGGVGLDGFGNIVVVNGYSTGGSAGTGSGWA